MEQGYTPYSMNKKTRLTLLGIAAGLLLLAVLWLVFRSSASSLNAVAKQINSYGYGFIADDLVIAYDNADTSIADVLDGIDLEDAVQASREAGFPSDVQRTGGVTLMLAEDDFGGVVTIYLVDGEIELCFVQTTDGGIAALNNK